VYRIAECYQLGLFHYNPENIFNDEAKQQTIHDFSCGASKRLEVNNINNLNKFLEDYKQQKKGRVIATCFREDATRLRDFIFQENDLIMLGNEYDGLDEDIIDIADDKIHIALPEANLPKPKSFSPIEERDFEIEQNGVPCLNVAVAAGIIGYHFHCWREDTKKAGNL